MNRRQPLELGSEHEESVGDVVVSFLGESDSLRKRPSEERFRKASKVEFEDGGDSVFEKEVERGKKGSQRLDFEKRRERREGRTDLFGSSEFELLLV